MSAAGASQAETADGLHPPSVRHELSVEGEEPLEVAEVQVPAQFARLLQRQCPQPEPADQTRYQVGSPTSPAGQTEHLAMAERTRVAELVLPMQQERASLLAPATAAVRPGELPAAAAAPGPAEAAVPELRQIRWETLLVAARRWPIVRSTVVLAGVRPARQKEQAERLAFWLGQGPGTAGDFLANESPAPWLAEAKQEAGYPTCAPREKTVAMPACAAASGRDPSAPEVESHWSAIAELQARTVETTAAERAAGCSSEVTEEVVCRLADPVAVGLTV